MKGMLIKIRSMANKGASWLMGENNIIRFVGLLVILHGVIHFSAAMLGFGLIIWGLAALMDWFLDKEDSATGGDPVTL